MVLPPFAPPPYVDSPAYMLPHPHLQPVDYRRLLPPQLPVPTAPYQNPVGRGRIRPPYAAPFRETVNSAVQTESARGYADGSPPIRSDSGHGTASDSPSSSSSSSHKQAESCCSTRRRSKDLQPLDAGESGADRPGGGALEPRATVEGQKGCEANVDQENIPPFRGGRCKVWSVGSPDSIVPVCSSSQQEDEVIRERRVSFPDILMSWGGATPQVTAQKAPYKDYDHDTGEEQEKSVCKSPPTTTCSVVLENSDDDSGSVLCPEEFPTESKENVEAGDSGRRSFAGKELLYSLNVSTEPERDEADAYRTHFTDVRGGVNESVWSVESLPPFVPPKDLRKLFDSEIIIEMSEEAESVKAPKGEGCGGERAGLCRTSSSDSWLGLTSDPPRAPGLPRRPEGEAGPTGQPEPGHEGQPPASLSPPHHDVTPTEEEQHHGSSEPEAPHSPNQEVITQNLPKSNGQSKRASLVRGGGAMEAVSGGTGDTSEHGTSPSRGHMVDCGIQCTSLVMCLHEEPRRCNCQRSGDVPTFSVTQSSTLTDGFHQESSP